MSASDFLEAAILDAVFDNTAYQNSARHLKLHTGDPGENGTTNPATETTRKLITGAASSGGVFTLANDLFWTSVAASETYAAFSIWDDATAGNCLITGLLDSPQAVEAGDDFTIPTGSLTVAAT